MIWKAGLRVFRLFGLPLMLALLQQGPALASESEWRFRLPVDCAIGPVCAVQNYFDHDPGPGFRDYTCGSLGYDGHDGTDFRVPSLAQMRAGVPVVAAATGVVIALRDGMQDVSVREVGLDAVRGREAGNGVILRHDSDWDTQYSHLLAGSIRVELGQRVEAGEVLGMIGLSGKTEFPHVHFEVRYQGRSVDPFMGLEGTSRCGLGDEPLWEASALDELTYRPTGLLQAGFFEGAPPRDLVEAGKAAETIMTADAQALVYWVESYGMQAGDVVSLRLRGPDGGLVAESETAMEGNKARWLAYVGRKRRGDSWPAGQYRGQYRLWRGRGADRVLVLDIERVIELR
jgi:hypothetical protein